MLFVVLVALVPTAAQARPADRTRQVPSFTSEVVGARFRTTASAAVSGSTPDTTRRTSARTRLTVTPTPAPEPEPTPSPAPVAEPTAPVTAPAPVAADALQRRIRRELRTFTDWLAANDARGLIGEVGWPNDADVDQWNALASLWYADATAAGLPVTAWASGDWWGDGYKLSLYSASNWQWTGADTARPSARVLEAQASAQRGVNVAGAEFTFPDVAATSPWSNAKPGVYGTQWWYSGANTFAYLRSRGVTTVRLPLRWERIQPQLGQPLDAEELGRLTAAVGHAESAGLRVILDVHNYGGYYLSDGTQGVRRSIGSPQVTSAHFSDLWVRLSRAFRTRAAVVGYGLMNEPVAMEGGARGWEAVSQAAVDAVRADGDRREILVAGYEWSGVQRWSSVHPRAWITDPAAAIRYEAHHYFDRDNSSRYAQRYAAEVTDAAQRGF